MGRSGNWKRGHVGAVSVWLDEITGSDVTVDWSLTGTCSHPADSNDFITRTGSATILAGTIRTRLDVQITGDTIIEQTLQDG